MNEFNSLINQMNRCSRTPAMFGTPENVLCACVHLSHICFSILRPDLDLERTKTLWAQIIDSSDLGDCLEQDEGSHQAHRWSKWGNAENVAYNQVVEAFVRIWNVLEPICKSRPHTVNWINTLFREPTLVSYPDNLEITLFCLISVAIGENSKQFRVLYKHEHEKIAKRPARSLADVGPETEWNSRIAYRQHDFPSYHCASRAIEEMIKYIENKVG